MSATRIQNLLQTDITPLIPILSKNSHKGQSGKIAVIGGSFEYTGAPYYSAITALKVGADISHVFCTEGAGVSIKAYSPELIVHPVIQSTDSAKKNGLNQKEAIAKAEEYVGKWLDRLHAVVIGPGLGRDSLVTESVKKLIELVKSKNLPLVIDGDGLSIISDDPKIINGYKKAVLTPNVNEFSRLCQALKIQPDKSLAVQSLCHNLGGVTIVQKGTKDIISDGVGYLECCEDGSPRRCGGQGDVLSGSIATFLAWSFNNNNNNNKSPQSSPGKQSNEPKSEKEKGNVFSPTVLSAYASSLLLRSSASDAFSIHKRGTTTPNIIDRIPIVFDQIWPSSQFMK